MNDYANCHDNTCIDIFDIFRVNKICFRSEELKLTIITAAPKWPSLQSFKDAIIDDDKDTGYFVKEMWSFSHERNW